jgi:hypothetical protein
MLRFQKVSDNLYRGSAPKKHEIPLLKQKYNITKIISLDKDSALDIHEECLANDIAHIIIPIHGSNDRDLELIKSVGPTRLIGNDIAYVHCKHGKDRTGLFVGKYRVENGWDCKKALDEALSFGFGTFMKKKDIIAFMIIIGCNDIDYSILDTIKDNSKNLCDECGMVMHNNTCNNCMISEALLSMSKIIKFADSQEGVDKKLESIVEKQKESPYSYEQVPDEILPGVNTVSNLFSPGATTSSIPNIPSLEVPTMLGLAKTNITVRIAFLKKLLKNAVTQQLSYEIPKSEKKLIKSCIDQLQELMDSEISIYSNQLDVMYKSFKDHTGIKPEQADKIQNYLDMYLEKLDDYLKNLKVKALKCIEILQKFQSDTDILSMLKSLDELLDNLKLYQDMLSKTIKEEKSEDFQQNAIKCLESIKKEIAQLKQLITERIMTYLNKNILGNNWSSDVKEDIVDDIKEQKVEQEIDDN